MNIKDSNMLTDKIIKEISLKVKINHNVHNPKMKISNFPFVKKYKYRLR